MILSNFYSGAFCAKMLSFRVIWVQALINQHYFGYPSFDLILMLRKSSVIALVRVEELGSVKDVVVSSTTDGKINILACFWF